MIAYFDESGSHRGAAVFGLACFVASDRRWDDFRKRWRRLLDQQRVPEIHMADLEARRGHFEGWSDERYTLVTNTIGAILSGVRLWGFYNAFLMKDYDDVIKRPEKKRRYYWAGTPYAISFQAILEMMAQGVASKLRATEPLRCICDRNDQIDGEARRRFDHLKAHRVGWDRIYGALEFASRLDELSLQAADVLAYEHGRWMQTWQRSQERGAQVKKGDMRPIMKRLIATKRVTGLFFDQQQIRALGLESLRRERANGEG